MKKVFLFFMSIIIMLTICSCSVDKSVKYTEVDSLESLTTQVGVNMTLPATARNITYYVENDIIAEINFSYSGIVYKYRASKVTAGTGLHGITDKLENETLLKIDERADITVYTASDGSRVAVWSKGGTNYSVYTEKNASDDTLTELCDLLLS